MMPKRSSQFRHLMQLTAILLTLVVDAVRFFRLYLRPKAALAAENLFLRKQLAMYQERQVKPQRATHASVSPWFGWLIGSIGAAPWPL